MTVFTRLNLDWNAEPNAPGERRRVEGSILHLSFVVNPFIFPFEEGARAELTFTNCWRYRLGSPDCDGWYVGQCRFGRAAPSWGDFYEVTGELLAEQIPGWKILEKPATESRHFLFYLRDSTFECDAGSWRIALPPKFERQE